jgi:hypothetical protein
METIDSNLGQINHEKAISNYFGIVIEELQKSQRTGLLFSVKAPKHFKIGCRAFYKKTEIDRFLLRFAQEPGDGL